LSIYLSYMKTKQTRELERFNPETKEFELIENINEDTMIEVMGVFDAEAQIVDRDMQTRSWMDNINGVLHIQYD